MGTGRQQQGLNCSIDPEHLSKRIIGTTNAAPHDLSRLRVNTKGGLDKPTAIKLRQSRFPAYLSVLAGSHYPECVAISNFPEEALYHCSRRAEFHWPDPLFYILLDTSLASAC